MAFQETKERKTARERNKTKNTRECYWDQIPCERLSIKRDLYFGWMFVFWCEAPKERKTKWSEAMREGAERVRQKFVWLREKEREKRLRESEKGRGVHPTRQPREQPNLNDKGWVGLVFWVGLGCFFWIRSDSVRFPVHKIKKLRYKTDKTYK